MSHQLAWPAMRMTGRCVGCDDKSSALATDGTHVGDQNYGAALADLAQAGRMLPRRPTQTSAR